MRHGRYYQESGRFDLGGATTAMVVGLLAGALIGFLYGVIDNVNPLIYVNALGSLACGWVAGAGAGLGARWGKVRNARAAALAGLAAGVVALWASWIGWTFALLDWETLLLDPRPLSALIQLVNAKGAWTLKGATPTGWALWGIWSIEALMILGAAVFGAWCMISEEPYCEECGAWADDEVTTHVAPYADRAALVKSLEAEDYEALLALPGISPSLAPRFLVEARRCPRRGAPYFLKLSIQTTQKNSKGHDETSTERFVTNLLVPERVYEWVRAGGAAPGAAPPDASDQPA